LYDYYYNREMTTITTAKATTTMPTMK